MSALLLIILLVVLIVVHELGHFTVAKLLGIHVEEFGIGYPPRAFTIGTFRGTTYTINWLPFGGFVSLREEDGHENSDRQRMAGSFASAPRYKQALVLIAGVAANALFGWMLFAGGLMMGMPTAVDEPTTETRLVISSIVPGSPAERVGLRAGDEVTAVSDSKGATAEEVSPQSVVDFVSERGGESLTVFYTRAEEQKEVSLTPTHAILPDTLTQPALGVGLVLISQQKLGFFEALQSAFGYTVSSLVGVTRGLGTLAYNSLFGNADIRVLMGPVGLAGAVGDAASHGYGQFFGLAALVSINLVIINLLPIPALDGGRLVFVAIEAVRRKKMPRTAAQIMNALGFMIVIALMLAVTYNDIIRLVG